MRYKCDVLPISTKVIDQVHSFAKTKISPTSISLTFTFVHAAVSSVVGTDTAADDPAVDAGNAPHADVSVPGVPNADVTTAPTYFEPIPTPPPNSTLIDNNDDFTTAFSMNDKDLPDPFFTKNIIANDANSPPSTRMSMPIPRDLLLLPWIKTLPRFSYLKLFPTISKQIASIRI